MAPFIDAKRRRAMRAELDAYNKEHGVDRRTNSHGYPALDVIEPWPKCYHCGHALHIATKRNASLGVPPIPLPPLYWRARQCLHCRHTFMIGVSEDGLTVELAPVKARSTWKREAKQLTEEMGRDAYQAAFDAEVLRRQRRAQMKSELADVKLHALISVAEAPMQHVTPEPVQRVVPGPGTSPIPEPVRAIPGHAEPANAYPILGRAPPEYVEWVAEDDEHQED